MPRFDEFDAKALLDERDPVAVANERAIAEARTDLRTAVADYEAAERQANDLLSKLEKAREGRYRSVRPQDLPKSIRDMRAAHTEAFQEAKALATRANAARQTLDRAKAKAEAQPNEPTAGEIATALRRGQHL